ncbi:MAG: LysR family transcriptional regulator substrate-binding protein [Cellulomonadaceae bacterium]|jgi:DNA-binding transcriptional LysR family regulator|nr:LysR family transcriptional regulator substrate-binding protein [Cellulomonadaceae bacterium]
MDTPLELIQVPAADATQLLTNGALDAALLRLPVDTATFSAIPLYTEDTVVVVHRDHIVAALEDSEEASTDDVAEETLWIPLDDVLWSGAPESRRPGRTPVGYRDDGTADPSITPTPPTSTEEAIAWVGNGAGITVVPMSLARLHRRKDVTYRRLTDVPTSRVALAWVTDTHTDLTEEMIGIVRGRTAHSSRGAATSSPQAEDRKQATKKTTSAERKAKQGDKRSGSARAPGSRGTQQSRSTKQAHGTKLPRGTKPSRGSKQPRRTKRT